MLGSDALKLLMKNLAEKLGYELGQMASVMAATRMPATTAATPFFVDSFWRTRTTYGTSVAGLGFGVALPVDTLGMISPLRPEKAR